MRSTWTIGAFTLTLASGLCAGLARADVIDAAANGFTVKNVVTIAAAPPQVYRQLTNIGQWWSSEHTFSGDARKLSLDARAGGCFCERLGDRASVRHLEVVFAAPGKTLRLSGGLGPLQAMAVTGSMTWQLTPADNGTRVEMTYTVGGYRPGGLQELAWWSTTCFESECNG